MKKKFLIALLVIAVATCLFAISVSASEIDYSETATLLDGTVLPIYDENQNPLIWFISGTTDEGGVTKNVYSSIVATQSTADENGNFINLNTGASPYGSGSYVMRQNGSITYGGTSYSIKNTVVIANLKNNDVTDIQGGSFGVLQYVYLPDDIISLGDYTSCGSTITMVDATLCKSFSGYGNFRGSKIKEIKMPKELAVNEDGTYVSEVTIPDWRFQNCTNLVTFEITDNTVSIGRNAFQGCNALTSVTGGCKSLKIITYDAFVDCKALVSFDMSEATVLESIGDRAFRYCPVPFVLPSCVKVIGQYAFAYSGIVSASMPNVEKLGQYAFAYTTSLTEAYIGGKLTTENMGQCIFEKSTALKKVEFAPDCQLTSLTTYFLQGCTSLIAISLPDSISPEYVTRLLLRR